MTKKQAPAKRFFTQSDYHEYWDQKVKMNFEEPHLREFLVTLGLKRTDTVCEVGAGSGRISSIIRGNVARYVGIDISYGALKTGAFEQEQTGTVDLIVADANALPFHDSCFDKSFCFSTLFFVPDQRGAIKELARISRQTTFDFANRLSPGGIVASLQKMGVLLFEIVRREFGTRFAVGVARQFIGREKSVRLARYAEKGLRQPYFLTWPWIPVNCVKRNGMLVSQISGFDNSRRVSWYFASKVILSSKRP